MVLACHIPYVFFVLKESLLIVIDEFRHKNMSKDLQQKLDEYARNAQTSAIQSPSSARSGGSDTSGGALGARKELPYMNMENCIYYPVTMGLYAVCVVLALFLNDLGVVFDIVGSFGFGVTAFALPCIFYWVLISQERMSGERAKKPKTVLCTKIACAFLMCVAVSNIVLVIVKMSTSSSTSSE